MKRAHSILLTLVLGTSIVFTACSKDTKTTESGDLAKSGLAKPVTLTFFWWGSQPRHDATIKVNELYKQKNPNVTVESQYQSFDGYYQKLSMMAASNNMPDVFQNFIGAADCMQFMDKGLIEPLDSYISKKLIDVSDISESTLSNGKLNGKSYGISLGSNAKTMVVDPDVFQKAGLKVPTSGYATWSDLEKDLPKLKEATGGYAADDIFMYSYILEYYLRQNSLNFYSDKNTIGFEQKTYVDLYTMKTNWIKNGWIPPYDVTLASKGPDDSQITKKKAAINVIYSSQYAAVSKAAGKALVMMPLPGPNSNKGMDIRAGSHISMSSTSKNKDEAAKFISYFINDIDANKILNAERGMPIASKVREALKTGFTAEQTAIADYLTKVEKNSSPSSPPSPVGSAEIDALVKDMEQQIVYGKIKPEDAYNKIKEQIDKSIQKK